MFGEGTGRIFLQNLECGCDIDTLQNCHIGTDQNDISTYSGSGMYDGPMPVTNSSNTSQVCTHQDDAGLQCTGNARDFTLNMKYM